MAFLVTLIITVSRWLYEMERGIWENGIQRNREKKIDFRKCSCFVIRILLWGIGLFFGVRLLSHISQSWLPYKWLSLIHISKSLVWSHGAACSSGFGYIFLVFYRTNASPSGRESKERCV